jgi:SAM-dependent methyltransferase
MMDSDMAGGTTQPEPAFIAFTICARNFLAQAQVLHDSLRRQHPGLIFYVALCDATEGIDLDAFAFEVLPITDLGIPQLDGMVERYNITELNTAIKPFAFLSIFARHPGACVAYFDPDILVTSPLDELSALLADGADCVLTPHLTEPAEFAESDDSKMLLFGIYNLGFCALRDTPEVSRVVAWWGRRLETHCVIDLPAGLFVDQKWADLLPAFIARTAILRHPGYNVAYWNLSQRTVRASPDKGWLVNGQPLRFFHFSGSVVDEAATFTRHNLQFRSEALRDISVLFQLYCNLVRKFGRDDYRAIPYAFSWSGSAGINLHTPSAVAEAARARGSAGRGAPLALGTPPAHLPLLRARSLSEYRAATSRLAPKIARRRALEASLIPHGDPPHFEFQGHCIVCGTRQPLQASFMYSGSSLPDGRAIPNWREHLNCVRCGYVNRLRASLHVLLQEIQPSQDTSVYITEQVTPLYSWLTRHFKNVAGSEYLGHDRSPGQVVDGIRHEDIQNLSYADASFDLVMSFDVLEHVPHEQRAFRELFRCLKPGGTLMFTAPFKDISQQYETRAVLRDDGTIEHLMEPEYHGNPVDPEGSLCFRYYGWRLMDDLRAAGFESPEGLFYWSAEFGYLGTTNNIFLARKPLSLKAQACSWARST